MAASSSSQTSGSSSPWLQQTQTIGFNQENSSSKFDLDWASPLSFLDHLDSGDEDVEVTKNITGNFKFDPVVGGRNSTRSSSSRSSGSTGFYEAVELSPVSSISPQHFEQQAHHDLDESTNLCQLMSNFQINEREPQKQHQKLLVQPHHHQQQRSSNLQQQIQDNRQLTFNQQTMKNLAALAQLTAQNCSFLAEPFSASESTISSLAVAPKPPSYTSPFESFSALTTCNNSVLNFPANTSNNLTSQLVGDRDCIPMNIRCKFGNLGPNQGQFHSPHGFCMGLNEDIVVADTYNHRIQIFDKDGQFKYSFGVPGKEEGKLWYPRKIAVLQDSGNFVICDRGNERSRMQIFSSMGHFIRRIQIRFIDIVAGLAIDKRNRIVAVDSVTPTIFVLDEVGNLLNYIECADYMSEPSDIAIFGDHYYICDFKGHSIVVIHESGSFVRRIGSRPYTNFPNGIDISDQGDILVGDSHGNQFHVAIYDRLGQLISQFQCDQVKVSRCCGLKITSEGYIVTLAKNNHHVLVLDTLFVP